MPKPKIERLNERLTAAMMIEAGTGYLIQKFEGYEPKTLLNALDLARAWVAEQIARTAAEHKEKK